MVLYHYSSSLLFPLLEKLSLGCCQVIHRMPRRLPPGHKFLLSIPEALTKMERVMQALQPPHKRGPKLEDAIEITEQIFKDLQTVVPDIDRDQLWQDMGRRRKYSQNAQGEIWLPSLAELQDVKAGVYPYTEIFVEQLRGTGGRNSLRGTVEGPWTSPVVEAFLRGKAKFWLFAAFYL